MIGNLLYDRVISDASNSKTACKAVLELGEAAYLQLITDLSAYIGLKLAEESAF